MRRRKTEITREKKCLLRERSTGSRKEEQAVENRQYKQSGAEKNKQSGKFRRAEAGRRSGAAIMGRLIGLVRPLWFIIVLAVLFGSAGYLCAIFLTILAAGTLTGTFSGGEIHFWYGLNAGPDIMTGASVLRALLPVLVGLAVLRGVLHYAEQYCNHFIAFKLLAILRHEVFAALRRLCPAKLEGKDRGNLISVITSDIELLEVFYAHTISPIAIAVATELVMVCFLAVIHPAAAVLAFFAYVTVGAVIPLWNGRKSGGAGMKFRNAFGDFNSFLLDSFRGIDETLQYAQGEKRKEKMQSRACDLGGLQRELNRMEGSQRAVTNLAILGFSLAMFLLSLLLYRGGNLEFSDVIICTTAMMGSFGPVSALSSLSNNLSQTLASGERVLSILEEEPVVKEVPETESWKQSREWKKLPERARTGTASPKESGRGIVLSKETGSEIASPKESGRGIVLSKETGSEIASPKESRSQTTAFSGATAEAVSFCYNKEENWILQNCNFRAEPGKITGIHGPSGCGKSTLLKLLMRFWDTDSGTVRVSGQDVRHIPTRCLRDTESYVTQETHLFHDSIAANIAIGKPGASMEEIREAARKASVDEFIMTLPNGYETEVGELGDTLSGGERQRIGIARAFLHDAPLMLLDEPTSNLDSLNEGIILKSLREEGAGKTVVLVSHRESTMQVADTVVKMGTVS